MTEIEFYNLYGDRHYDVKFPSIYVVKDIGSLVADRVKILYLYYEDEYDEDIYEDILYSMSKSWKFLEKKLIKYMVDGRLNLQFIRELANLNFKNRNSLMVLNFDF